MTDHKEVVDYLLSEHSVVCVLIDGTDRQAIVPAHLQKAKTVVLDIGLNMRKPIPDLKIFETHWSGTLSFGGDPCLVMVPWSAVYAVYAKVGNQCIGRCWKTPPEDKTQPVAKLKQEVRKVHPSAAPAKKSSTTKQKRVLPNYLRVVK